MSKSVRQNNTGGNGKEPLAPTDFLSQYEVTQDPFGDVKTQEKTTIAKFNPNDYEYVNNPSSLEKGTERVIGVQQPLTDMVGRTLKQFGANAIGAIAQSAMNTVDVESTLNILTGKEDQFNSKLFGVSTRDIMDWTREVQQNNRVYENEAGTFNPADPGWWANQISSAGTGVGMAAYALGETALIGAATEGLGAVPTLFKNIAKFPQLMRMMRAAKTAEEAYEVANLASKLKRTATTYAIMNRLNESKMEAQQTFHESYDELRAMKNPDGTAKYTEEEARNAAAAGATRDFMWNMPLMALDILTYRTMVYNPFSGAGTGLVERGLSRAAERLAKAGIAGKAAGWALPHLVGSASEGLEEGLQFVGAEEGKHYARVMAGLDDGSSFFKRFGKDLSTDEFWNNFAGGVIGSPIIGGTMKLFNNLANGRSQKQLNTIHKDFISNIGTMDSHIGEAIRSYEANGNKETADVLRRNFGAMKALSSLYIDGLKGSGAAFDSYKNFLQQTLDEVNSGNLDSLKDLGFTNPTNDQVDEIKKNFGVYLQDADRMKKIFDQVSNQHERQFVPQISQQMFSVETRRAKQLELDQQIIAQRDKVFGYTSLTPQGKDLHDINYKLQAYKNELRRLEKLKEETVNPLEAKNVDAAIAKVEEQLKFNNDRIDVINRDQSYTHRQKVDDSVLLSSPIKDNQYYQLIRDSIANTSQIDIESRDLALWNNQEYKDEQTVMGVINSRTKDQLNILESDLIDKGKMTPRIQDAIKRKRDKLATEEAKAEKKAKEAAVAQPSVTNPVIQQAQSTNPVQAQPVQSPNPTVKVQQQQAVQSAATVTAQPVVPQGNAQNAPAVSPTQDFTQVPGDSDLFGPAMNSVVGIAAEQQAKSNVTEVTKTGTVELAKIAIPNIEEVINDGGGRLQITYDGDVVPVRAFDIHIMDNTTVVSPVKAKGDVAPELLAFSFLKLDEALRKEGRPLVEMVDTSSNKELWEKLIAIGRAVNFNGVYQTKDQPIPDAGLYSSEVEVSFAPAEINDDLTQEQKTKLQQAVQILLTDTINPSFEDLVRKAIKQSNLETTDRTFNLLAKGWELNGYPKVDYMQTYMKVFQDPMGTINSLLRELSVNQVDKPQSVPATERATEAAIEDTINHQQEPTDFDNNGQPIYNYTGIVTDESAKKFAFLSVPYTTTTTLEDDGSLTINKQNIEGDVNQGDYVDSLKLLDPNKYTEGTEMQVAIPSNFLDIKVSVNNEDGTQGTAITFGQYIAKNNLTPDDQEYKDKIPMIIYDKGELGNKGVAFVHDVQWYNPMNFLQTSPGEMETAINSTREMRQAVLDTNGEHVNIVITSKRETTFDGLKLPQGTQITLNEANPQTTLTVAKNMQQLTEDGKNIVFDGELMNVKPFIENMAYDVRQTGRRDGKPVYTAFPVTQPNLSPASKESIIMALKVFVNAKNTALAPGDKSVFDNVHAQILSASGIDIRSVNGINQYLSQFMHVFAGNNVRSVEDAESQLKGLGKKEGYKYLTINSGGGITFGTLGKPLAPKNNGFFINPNPGNNPEKSFQMANSFLDNITKTNFLEGYQQHVHFGSVNRNKPVVQVNLKGEVNITPTYKEYLMNTLTTNVRSLNIGTQDKPNYVTNVQPIITYELTEKVSSASKPKSQAEIKAEVIPADTVVDQRAEQNIAGKMTSSVEDESAIKALRESQLDLIKQAREELGLDFLNDIEDFSPYELSEQQRDLIAESVQNIAGLNPQQQSELIDFMYNQVVALIDMDNKEGVSRDQVYSEVKKTFESIIKPLRKTFGDKVKQLKDMIALDPNSPHMNDMRLAIASYEKSIERINDIQANYKLMEEETQQRVEKYTNIEKGKIFAEDVDEDSEESEVEDMENAGDGSKERQQDFGVDSLTENPDNKLTYAMRRFLGQIRKVDKDGNPMVGFLRLPVYVGTDTVASTVRDLLADVPSDFNTMMEKLERSVPAHGWLRELIDRLKASNQERKNQFVTVMSNHRLSMKFSMISFDRKTKTWTSKVYDTFQSGLANQLALSWNVNFLDSDLVKMVNEVYTLNEDAAKALVNEYESWIGANVPTVKSSLDSITAVANLVNMKRPMVVANPKGDLKNEIDALKPGDRLRFKQRGIDYQIMKVGSEYQIRFFDKSQAIKPEGVRQWLEKIGIVMSDKGFEELMNKGLRHNFEKVVGDKLFTDNNGLFKILADALRTGINSPNKDLVTGDGNPLSQSVIKSLANLESNFNTSVNSPNGRDGGKSIFGFTAPKFITDRTRDLKTQGGEVVNQLSSISFSKKSLWLDLLVNSDKFRDQFEVSHIGLTAMKELGKKVYKDNSITKLSDVDHELTKLIMFWDTKQGSVEFNSQVNTYGDTTIPMRMATVFVPTMSDKSNMMLLKTAVLGLEDKHFNVDSEMKPKVGKDTIKAIYEQCVRPELLRMIKHAQIGGKTNVSAYDKGARMFLLMPSMNSIRFNEELLLIDAIANGVDEFNLEYIESRFQDRFFDHIEEAVTALVDQKLKAWEESGFLKKDKSGTIVGMDFIDKKYADKFSGNAQQKATKAAIDFEVNSMIATANSFMLYAGDPAIYFKSKAMDYIQMAKDTFVNVGKRLANQIAPGTTIANSQDEKYIQVFLEDRKSLPEISFLKFATRVNDGKEITDKEIEVLQGNDKKAKEKVAKEYPKSAGYFSIEGSDAQEYTTWKEHLSLLERLGKTSDSVFDITPNDIQEARELFASWEDGKRAKLTPQQEKLIGKVLQPMKPVYTGQIYDAAQDLMRVMYIKSSSFPLIPQLTSGLEIDTLRQAMEGLEKNSGMSVRASYQTANKVGSVNNPINIWNQDGTINKEEVTKKVLKPVELATDGSNAAEFLATSSLVLDRKNFRIQQDVPFKSGKKLEDKITLGTQLMKILFGNGVIDADGFTVDGVNYTGKELHRQYNQAFDDLIKIKKAQLYDELGLDEQGLPVNEAKSIQKLQKILKEEAINRGYPIQDIEGLNLDQDGNFITPLWSSANSNRYESMLNAIVTNRIVKIKFPGNSYVVGSEEGFKFSDNLEGIEQSKVIWTSKWNGSGLQGSYKKDGTIEKAQVLVASKFRDREGKLIDLFTKKNGEYTYISKSDNGSWILKEDMFDPELLSLTSFRIPTSGHVSAAQVEIVGFLPAQNADLMIVPRNFTKQMGLDFDVDKQNTYQLWHYMNDEGKFEVLTEETKRKLLNSAKGEIKDGTPAGRFMSAIFGDELPDFTIDEINADTQLRALNAKLEEKLLQNKIVKIHASVLTNPNDKIQAKINGILSTDYAENQADLIEELLGSATDTGTFTPLSSEYQKMKMGLGAAGKIGTGAYSLDVVFHSLIQQLKSLDKPMNLTEVIFDEEGKSQLVDKEFRFGTQVSDGTLGNERTLDGDRSISEVLAELQNIALDNEKLQVMGRVGLNDLTIDVSKVFALLGFDKGTDKGKSSVQFLFLSQPVIRDYVKLMKNASSNMAEFSQDREQMVIDELLKKYNMQEQWSKIATDESYKDFMARRMGTQEMLTSLQGSPDPALQAAILQRFFEMRSYGVAIRGIQTGINTDAKGLGKSFFDVIAKKEAINKLGAGSPLIQGATNLIGDYISLKKVKPEEYNDKIKEGYVDIGNFLVKPTSLTGSFNVHAITSAYNLWSKHLPYDTNVINFVYEEIMDIVSSTGDASALIDNKAVMLKQEIFKSLKKYFSANAKNGIVNTGDDVGEERRRLYIDSEENTSLAKYIKSLRETTNNKVIDNYIKSNKLINRFEFDIQKNGSPSLIKFNNAVGEEFDEQYLYNSLGYLLSANAPLPELNGKSYTTTKLAQDLIAYTYLGNATQEAIQFAKYIPVIYNNIVGYSQFMRDAGNKLHGDVTIVGGGISNPELIDFGSAFAIQFVQHNPERVRVKIPEKELKMRIHSANKGYSSIDTLESFSLVTEEGSLLPKFVSIYNSGIQKGEKKFQLYIQQGDGTYKRIPVLGTFGMDEYNPDKQVAQSLINGRPKATVTPSNVSVKQTPEVAGDTFGINTGNGKMVLENIAKNNIQGLSDLARELAPFASNITIGYEDMITDGKAIGNTVTVRSNINSEGDYKVAMTVLHEVTHALTVQQIMPYLTEVGNTYQVATNAPAYVNKLVQLYNVARQSIGEDRIAEITSKINKQKAINDQIKVATTEEEKNKLRDQGKSFSLTADEKRVYYGAFNIREFIAMSLTQPEFQREMARHKFKATDQSLLDKFKEVLNSILRAIGVDYSENSVTAQAINSIFELITDKNVRVQDNTEAERFDEIAIGGFSDFQDSITEEDQALLDKLRFGGDPEISLSVAELPTIPNINENNCY